MYDDSYCNTQDTTTGTFVLVDGVATLKPLQRTEVVWSYDYHVDYEDYRSSVDVPAMLDFNPITIGTPFRRFPFCGLARLGVPFSLNTCGISHFPSSVCLVFASRSRADRVSVRPTDQMTIRNTVDRPELLLLD